MGSQGHQQVNVGFETALSETYTSSSKIGYGFFSLRCASLTLRRRQATPALRSLPNHPNRYPGEFPIEHCEGVPTELPERSSRRAITRIGLP